MSETTPPDDENTNPPADGTVATPAAPAVSATRKERVGNADAPRTPPAPRPRATLATLLALAALLLGGYAAWQGMQTQQRMELSSNHADEHVAVVERLDALDARQQALRGEVERLRTRQQDAQHVSEGAREELLSLAERSRHLEDAVANLARQRSSNRDALMLNEAEYLLQIAAQQLTLFHDVDAARQAYQLADSALAGSGDAVYASVRQTIASELRLLEHTATTSPAATVAALERLRGQLATLPLRRAADTPDPADEPRWMRLLSRFVRIERSDGPGAMDRDPQLARLLPAIDIRAAQAAALAHDEDAYAAALAHVDQSLQTLFDPQAPAVAAATGELARLRDIHVGTRLPELGSARRELRNLRATQSLSRPAVSPASPDSGDDGADIDAAGDELPVTLP